jgi:hypothetical protein
LLFLAQHIQQGGHDVFFFAQAVQRGDGGHDYPIVFVSAADP